MDYITDEIRKLHNKNREELSKVIESKLMEYGISYSNPEYYKRCSIKHINNGKQWCVDGKPIFWESDPIISHDLENNKITMTIEYRDL